jgi:hypothetical protein
VTVLETACLKRLEARPLSLTLLLEARLEALSQCSKQCFKQSARSKVAVPLCHDHTCALCHDRTCARARAPTLPPALSVSNTTSAGFRQVVIRGALHAVLAVDSNVVMVQVTQDVQVRVCVFMCVKQDLEVRLFSSSFHRTASRVLCSTA